MFDGAQLPDIRKKAEKTSARGSVNALVQVRSIDTVKTSVH